MEAAQRHPADSRDLGICSRPPGRAGVLSVRDVLLVPTKPVGTDRDGKDHPPAGGPAFQLGRGLSLVERLDGDENQLVMASCDARGHFFVPSYQFGVRQAYVRDVDLADYERHPYEWDHDGTISVAYKLSRLVRDNAVCTEYAARVIGYSDGQKQVIPGPVGGEWATAYYGGSERDWLDTGDAASWRELVDAYWTKPGMIVGRLDRAVRYCEQSAHCKFAEYVVQEVVTGLEALLNTHRHQAVRQFVQRVPQLARELGIRGVTKRFCEQMYRWRSQAAHGARISMFSGRARADTSEATGERRRALKKAALIQSVLRAVVATAILDAGLRRSLRRAGGIRQRWPAADAQGKSL